MKLVEFIKSFSHNNLIRLHYKEKRGLKIVLETFEDVSMDWEVLKGVGKNRHYLDNKVLSIKSILVSGSYPEAINIVIEKLENQPFVIELIEEKNSYHEST